VQHVVKLPKMGDTTEEVLVLEWAVAVGDAVEVGQPLMHVETDKVTNDVPAPVAGVVAELLVAVDDEVPIGAPICAITA